MGAWNFDQNNNLTTAPGKGTVSRSNAGSIALGQTDFNVNGRVTTSASTTVTVPLGTVPAGKTLFVTDLNLSTIATTEVDVVLQYTLGGVGPVPIFRQVITSTSPCNGNGIESQPSAPAGAALSLLLPIVAAAPNVDFAIGAFGQ